MKVPFGIIITLLVIACGCAKNDEPPFTTPPPVEPLNYADLNNWAFHPNRSGTLLENYNLDIAVIDKNLQVDSTIAIPNNATVNTGVDVFFVHPTVLAQMAYPPQNIAISEQSEFLISATIIAQGGLLAKYGRFFAPRYRQSTGTTYQNTTPKELQAAVIAASYNDVKAAFLNYLTHYNNGNKIVLAGHSQGSFLLAMLLRDVFDEDQGLTDKLVTAALGGMGYVYASQNNYVGGWWQTIPLCTSVAECGCVHNWRSFAENQALPEINTALPEFNAHLVSRGLVYRTVDQNQDWFVQDSTYYGTAPAPLRYYLVSDENYNLGGSANYIAFDSLYSARFKRDGPHRLGLSIGFEQTAGDQRPDDLANEAYHPNFNYWGYHRKDYNIYAWALMEQIDSKLLNCN